MGSPADEPFLVTVGSVAAGLRQASADLAVFADLLADTLARGLPAGTVQVERDRSVTDRLRGRSGRVRLVRVSLTIGTGERASGRVYVLRATGQRPEALVSAVSGGVTLSTTPLPVPDWCADLATELVRHAEEQSDAAAALERIVLPRASEL